MKRYQLGALKVADKGMQDTKEEIVIELIDRMQKYVVDGEAAYRNESRTKEQRLRQVEHLSGRFCGLVEFLQVTMGIDVREENGMLYTQTLYNRFHYWKMMLRIEIEQEKEEHHGNDHD